MDIGLLLLRLVVGLTVAAHGAQKLLGWFGGPGRDGFAAQLANLGFRRTRPYTWLAGAAELVGGLSVALGLVTPLAVAAVLGVMVTAGLVVHLPNGFFTSEGGLELPLLVGAAAATIALTGPGAYALDVPLDVTASPFVGGVGILLGITAGLAMTGVHRLESRGVRTDDLRTA